MDKRKNTIPTSSFYGRRSTSLNLTKLHPRNTYVPDSSESEEESDPEDSDPEDSDLSSEEESDSEKGTDESDACNNDDANGNHHYDKVDQSSNDSGSQNKTPASVRWRKCSPVKFDVRYTGPQLPPPPDVELTPLQYFKMFFDDKLISHIAEQTNLYSVQNTGSSINTTPSEIEQYLGILIIMSIIRLPQVRMYWSKETQIPAVANVMSVNRFEKLRKFFHCNDNTNNIPLGEKDHDKLFKVRPVLDSVLENCRKVPQEERHSIDEQILPTKARTKMKQYCPKKPKKWGIKVWARCGVSGLVYDFEVYTGKSDDAEEFPELLMGGNVVRRLCKTLPKNVNHKVYFDNYFSSINLLQYLTKEKIWAIATIRRDRLKGAEKHLKTEKEMKKEGRGAMDWIVEANSGIIVIKWLDNGTVQLTSNYIGKELGPPAKRWSKKEKKKVEITRPLAVHEYNIHMGGVDLCDMLLALYRICRRSIKYYMHIIFYCLGISIVNGWLLYRRHMNQKGVPEKDQLKLVSFKAQIADSLTRYQKDVATKRGRPSSGKENPAKKRRACCCSFATKGYKSGQNCSFPRVSRQTTEMQAL